MNKIEHHILCRASGGGYPIGFLAQGEDAAALSYLVGHEVPHEELLNILHDLFKGGYLLAFYDYTSDKPPIMMTLSFPQLEMAAAFDTGLDFVLTEKGGELWEVYSKPDWNQDMDMFDDPTNNQVDGSILTGIRVVSSANRQLLEQYIAMLTRHGVIKGQISWEELKPFDVTYWKTLPLGYEARFPVEIDLEPKTEEEWARYHEEMDFLTRRWYIWPGDE